MKTLKIAAIDIGVVLATALLALVLGVPAGPVVGPLQNRVEADTKYRLRIAGNSTVALWPSPTLTVRDISLFDANPLGNLTAESMRFSMTFWSLFAGYPRISEIAIARRFCAFRSCASDPSPRGTHRCDRGATPPSLQRTFESTG